MADEHQMTARYRKLYARLIRLYPKPHRERFGEEMTQTFNDLLRQRAAERKSLLGCALWMFGETTAGIIREGIGMMTMKSATGIALAMALTFITAGLLGGPDLLVGIGILSLPVLAILMAFVAYREAKPYTRPYRIAMGLALAAAIFMIWASLGVGIIGADGDPINVVYFGVFAVGIAGAAIGRFEPQGMARALFATALAQLFVAAVAIMADWGMPYSPPAELVTINGFFIALWLVAALLFRQSARTRARLSS